MSKSGGSIRDVARETGLSTATVSRVMNGGANVSKATRDKVLTASKKLDYIPNPAAKALSTARSNTVAAIIPTIENSVFAKYISSLERTLAKRGFSLVLAIAKSEEEEEAAALKLLGMGAEAFILSGASHSPSMIELLRRRRIPFAFTSVWDGESQSPTIGYDNASIACEAIGYLAAKGHHHISVLHGPLAESDRTRLRLEGARRAAGHVLDLTVLETELSVAGGKQATKAILQDHRQTTAILCFSDVLALGAYSALAAAKLEIPKDVSVMGFDNLDWSKDIEPPLSTFDLPAEEMGAEVANQVSDFLGFGSQMRHALLDCKMIERGSVRDLSSK